MLKFLNYKKIRNNTYKMEYICNFFKETLIYFYEMCFFGLFKALGKQLNKFINNKMQFYRSYYFIEKGFALKFIKNMNIL